MAKRKAAESAVDVPQAVREAMGLLGGPPLHILREMVARDGVTGEQVVELLHGANFGAAPAGVLDALLTRGLVQHDADGKTRVKPEIADAVAAVLAE